MLKRSGGFPAGVPVLTALTVAWAMAIGLSAASGHPAAAGASTPSAKMAAATAQSAPADQANAYVGEDTCVTCHEDKGKQLGTTMHGRAQNLRTPVGSGRGCEACHGPGKLHVDGGGDKEKIKRFTTIAAKDANATCLQCHTRGTHANWQGSMHDQRNLSCVTCHSVHSPKSEKAQLKTVNVVQTCEQCHKAEVLKTRKVGHMPVDEGKMDCTTCHNPHGSTNNRMLKAGNYINDACVSCHTEKRGPFLWEHQPVRQGCVTCHDPHGSNNDRMLVAKAPMLCQRCHISTRHPPTVYDGVQLAAASNRLVGRACVNCHSQIHGSNSPSGNRFLR